MPSDSQDSTARDNAIVAWVQTRVVLRIVAILLAVAVLLLIVYKLTTVTLLVVPLVDLVQKPINIRGKERAIPRGLAIGIVYIVLFTGIGLAIYFLAPQ